jgi:mycofactocin biosynthesis protein MftB
MPPVPSVPSAPRTSPAPAPPSPVGGDAPAPAVYDGSRPWTLAPQVALRPEPFGALAYDFGTRRLSFLKSRTLLAVVEGLGDHPTGDAACAAAGVHDELAAYRRALSRLAESGMIQARDIR